MRFALFVVGSAVFLGGFAGGPAGLILEASSAASQTLCTSVFVSGLAPDDAFRLQLRPEPGMGAIAWAMHYEVDRGRREVRTHVFGGFGTRSVFREGRGCTLVFTGVPPAALRTQAPSSMLLPEIAGSHAVVAPDPSLRAAIDAAFAEPGQGSQRATAAVVVVHDGRVVGERYAPGYSIDMPLSGHSLAKSVVNALIGVLVRNGSLDVTHAAPVQEWRGSNDPRASITVDNLLRMDAGFGFDEGTGSSIATHMWYRQPDTAHFAAAASPSAAPGTQWGYSSRSYTILSRVVGDAIGGGPQGVNDFGRREIFDPLGMRSVTIEFDATGTMMGANSILASPRDWARFGLLYLNDGVVGGRRILPEGWVQYSTKPTLDTGYGAGFWLNTTDKKIPSWGFRWGLPGAPADAFMARGYLGQYIVVVPSENLVVVRFGYTHARGSDMEGVGRLVHDTIAALHTAAVAQSSSICESKVVRIELLPRAPRSQGRL